MREITIFYAWQSDLPDNTNRKAIRNALHLAIPALEGKDVKIRLDEATRNVPGSPNVPKTIIDKIKSADIYIGDLTTINKSCKCKLRKTPNPNVVFELGFAAAYVGWNRIIMLVNTSYTDLDDLPFDFDRHRATPYRINTKDKLTIKSSQNNLAKLLVTCIGAIIKDNPTKEIEKRNLSPEEIKRQRDLTNIKWIMSAIHHPTLQDFISDGPDRIHDRIFYFWEEYHGVFTNSIFHLYNEKLYNKFGELHKAWDTCLSFGQYYRDTNNPHYMVFGTTMDIRSDRQEKAWQIIYKALKSVKKALDDVRKMIRRDYIEIDINELNREAWKEYVAYYKENIEKLEKELK